MVHEQVELLDISLSDHELLALHFLCVNIGILLGVLLFNSLLMGLLLAVALFNVPRIIFLRMIRKRIKIFNSQLPDACQIMASTLKSGFSFRQCIQTIANDMPDPIGKEFSRVSQELNWGLNNREAFDNLYRRMPCDDLKLFTTSVIIQNEVGGKLSEVLIKISETIREREKIQGEIKSLTAQGKLSGIVIGALPLLLALVITLINPSYMQPLFAHPLGMILLGVAAFMQITGMLVINKMVKVN
jgi:tight adherence protein B